jgi:hypothetical protein
MPSVVLVAQDIAQDGEVVALLDEAHGDSGDRCLQRHTGIHQGQCGTTDGSHRAGAVGLEHIGAGADHIGEVLLAGQHCEQCAPGELAMTNLTPLGSTKHASLADAEWREVVGQHPATELALLTGIVDAL